MGVNRRIRLGYAAMLGLLLVQGLATVFLLHGTSDRVVGAVRNQFYAGIEFNRILVQAERVRRFEKEFFIHLADETRRDHYVAEWQTAVERLRQGLTEIAGDGGEVFSATDRDAVATWEGGLDYYASGFLAVVQSVEQGALVDPVLANARIGEFKERFAVLLEGADRAATETYESAEHAVSDIPRDLTRLNQVVAITVLAAALLAMVLSISVPRSVSRPIEQLSESARRMSLGDLEQKVEAPAGAVEFRELAGTLERMRVSQRVLLRQDRAG